MAEIRSQRQYIGGTKVYFLNRQGGSNLQDDFSVNLALLFKNQIGCANILAL
jgi:hypothetical protein